MCVCLVGLGVCSTTQSDSDSPPLTEYSDAAYDPNFYQYHATDGSDGSAYGVEGADGQFQNVRVLCYAREDACLFRAADVHGRRV